MEQQSRARRGCTARSWGPVDLPLVAYGLITGIVAVSAGTLVARAEQQIGTLTQIISLLTSVAIAVLSSFAVDSVLTWLRPGLKSSRSSRQS